MFAFNAVTLTSAPQDCNVRNKRNSDIEASPECIHVLLGKLNHLHNRCIYQLSGSMALHKSGFGFNLLSFVEAHGQNMFRGATPSLENVTKK